MATNGHDRVLSHIRRLAVLPRAAELTDRDLLECFLRDHDETAFAALVEHHGPMVLAVCRRMLHHAQDAEDACQATFLVLVRKAGSIRRRASLASWLHGVAVRVSGKLRASRWRRLSHGGLAGTQAVDDRRDDVGQGELLTVLDEELGRLPEKYRLPLVLCYLEGMAREAAALQLGLSPSTLRGRLDAGRERLRGRLRRRGFDAGAAALAALLVHQAAVAAIPSPLAVISARATTAAPHIVALAEGVLKAMSDTQLRFALTLLVVFGVAFAGVGAFPRGEPDPKAVDPTKGGAVVTKGGRDAPPAAEPVAAMLNLTETDNGKTLRLKVGDELLVRLDYPKPKEPGFGGTSCNIQPGRCVVELKDVDGALVARLRKAGLAGPDTGVFRFRATVPGRDVLRLRLAEKTTWQKRDFEVTLVVEAVDFPPIPKVPLRDDRAASWSRPVDGVSGRMVVAIEDPTADALRHKIMLELRNELSRPVAVFSAPTLEVELFDAAGKPIPEQHLPMSGPVPGPTIAVIPPLAYLGLRVDGTTVGVPPRKSGRVLLSLAGKDWTLYPGKYTLKVTVVGKEPPGAAELNAMAAHLDVADALRRRMISTQFDWKGRLTLPPVEVVVTPELLAPKE
jgi:RNA polymerase sigma factor (sigma-70 family)